MQLDSLTRGPFDYKNHFVSVNDLFLLRTADYGFLLGVPGGTPIQIGWFHWALAGLSLPAGLLLLRSGRRIAAWAVFLFAAFFALGVFMTISSSRFIWDTFDALRFMQFPWRYMGLVSLGAAGLAGAWLAVLRDRSRWAQLVVAAVLIGLFVGTGRTFFEPLFRCTTASEGPIPCPGSDEEYFAPERFFEHQRGSINDYLPAAVDVVPEEPPERPARVVDGSARIVGTSAGSDRLRFGVEAETPARIEAALFDYPNWRVRIDGQAVAHATSTPHGLVTFDVPAGSHNVEVRLEDTAVRRAANWLSLVSWVALALTAPAMLLAPSVRRWRARLRSPD